MSDPIARKHANLIDRLYDKTEGKTIDWEYDEARSEVSADVGNYKVSLVAASNPNGSPVEVVRIKEGFSNRLIEAFNDEELDGLHLRANGFESYWQKMEALRSAAYRQALGAEKAVDDILKELGDDAWDEL